MQIIGNKRYREMLCRLHTAFPHWGRLDGKTVLLSGASGMIGSFLMDAIMLRNQQAETPCRIIAENCRRTIPAMDGTAGFCFSGTRYL